MSSVIHTNVAAIRTRNVYNRNNDYMNVAMARVATGMKINSAKDNSSGWAITEKMRERIRANDQAYQNIQNDNALLKTAEDGMGNTLDILKTLKERAINAANDSNITSDRTKIAEEVRQLVAQIDDNAAKVKFNGRQLLNGGVEANSSAVVNSTGTVSPNSVTASGVYADKAVYSITGFNLATGAATDGTAELINLIGANGETLFQEGDKITLSWTDNGESKQASIGVAGGVAISDLSVTGLTGAWVNAGADTGAKYTADNTKVLAGNAGLYFSGTANHNISDLSISVTTGAGITRTAAQEALTPTAVVQSVGNTSKGSNLVYGMALATADSNQVRAGDQTQFYQLGAYQKDVSTADYTIEINEQTFKFKGSTTLADLNKMFKESGLDVEIHYTETAKDPLTYEGNTVTMGTYGSTAAYNKTDNTSLYFVAGANQNISNLSIVSTEGSSKFLAASSFDTALGSNSKITQKLALDDTGTGGTTSTNSTMLPQGETLQFFVGGEQNFGVNFSIGKATVGNLLGNDANTFANKFLTKEGAESAISVIDNAISKTLTEQTRLGAMEARLGYTSDNIVSMNENLEAGISAYRDSDMAKEMVEYMRYSVLSQTSQAMLAQASQNPFSVLNLLQQ